MGAEERDDSTVEQALAGGTPQRVGWWRFYFADEHWEWSPEVEQIHGYAPGTAGNPTTPQVLSHKHPEDYEHIAATLDDIRRTHKPFSTRHRIIRIQGEIREVVVTANASMTTPVKSSARRASTSTSHPRMRHGKQPSP